MLESVGASAAAAIILMIASLGGLERSAALEERRSARRLRSF
jgi:hypothetical protein